MSVYKKLMPILLLLLLANAAQAGMVWTKATHAQAKTQTGLSRYMVVSTDEQILRSQLLQTNNGNKHTIDLPMPNGSIRTFSYWATDVLPPALAARYTGISTYTAEAVDDHTVTAKLDYTPEGFHAMIFDGNNTALIDPAAGSNGLYVAHYKRDELKNSDEQMKCMTDHSMAAAMPTTGHAAKTVNSYMLRTYRIAVSCNHQYAQAATGFTAPTKAQVLARMTTTMNRINGVFERELSITMKFVDKQDTLIFTQESADPFGSNNNNPVVLLNLNQKICDSLIGPANYDLGHIFSTGGGGLSQVGCVCTNGLKAQSVTGSARPTGDGFDIDYVVHEIGHEFGSQHTFNNNSNGSCAGNAEAEFAYEPGSGSTIMAYAGICSPDNIQRNSDDYFCASSLVQIYQYITTGGNGCAVKTPNGAKPVSLPDFTSFYHIPISTPFELTAPAYTDSVADTSVTYCWEQWNLGDFGKTFAQTYYKGPIFRSYAPVKSPVRVFPNIHMVLADSMTNEGTDNAQGEKVPEVQRILSFRLTMRSIYNGNGSFLFPDDSVHVVVEQTDEPFKVTSQATAGIIYIGGSVQTVTWNTAHTNEVPINTSEADIYLSIDGGNTWEYHLGKFPNTGSAVVTMPNPTFSTYNARIKVKGHNNIFLSTNTRDFTLYNNPGTYGEIQVFPNPATNKLTILTGTKGTVDAVIYDATGRTMWTGKVDAIYDVDISLWARGIYIIRMKDVLNQMTIKKVSVR